ncbi:MULTISPECIES: hypothetical protein [Bacillus]|uniref:hypothetical protein n=1 Tax=Bacillus TaxID=1386 RepID=UPI000C791A26|nr:MULTISPECIES: hypothetical protein [Bacillus]MCP1161254.1 hypothetical protein [Bacillus infantis]PLR70575.1 hypothetical protein CYJ37_23895 [Bacillus sp. UMB0728]
MIVDNNILNKALKAAETEYLSLKQFIEQEGHPNEFVSRTIQDRLKQLEIEISNLNKFLE